MPSATANKPATGSTTELRILASNTTFTAFAMAVIAPLLAFAAWLALRPVVEGTATPIFFTVAVAATAWRGGFVPALVTTAISLALVVWFMMPPAGSFLLEKAGDQVRVAAFALAAILMSGIGGASLCATRREQHARAELERTNAQLEKRVELRTAELSEAVRSLESFSYSVSHDLRAPLRGIKTHATILREDHSEQMPPDAIQCLDEICNAANRMDGLIQDILSFSQLSVREIPLEGVNLLQLLETIMTTQPEITQKRHCITLEVAPELNVVGNKAALDQALTNLLSNALKFMPGDRIPAVQLRCEPRRDLVRVLVADNGLGIAPQYHEKVWSVFERLNGFDYPGSGIGLSIVKRAVERMNGQVGVESEPGRGSCFWIELPRATAPVTAQG